MSDVLVSVIMPSYNTENYISLAIESILNQTYKNLELIILDDASTDKTWEIIQEYTKKDSRIISIRNEKNLYIAGNRNKGISLARGKYIVWQDSDDISVLTRIQKQVDFMEKHPEVGICGGFLQSFNEAGNLDIRMYDTTDVLLRKNIFKYSPVAQPSAIIRSECFKLLGDFDVTKPPAEDIDMSFRIGTKYKFANLPEILIFYREHSTNNTISRMQKLLKSTLEVRRKYSIGFGYTMNFTDEIAYFLTWLMFFIPAQLVVPLFKIARFIARLKVVK